MANINQISLKVCGNPDANSGFQPMVIFNSPSIEIKDTVYAGFDANSYFFTIKIEKNQVVYKLVKNNVSSLGASRQGCLVFGISIPKGYKLDAGYSPFDVLMELKKGFLARCMTCKDPAIEKYEFSSNRVQPNILDDIAGAFSIVPTQKPYHTMTVGAPIAYVTAAEDKIEQLLRDVHYSAFAKYSEIVVAENVQSTTYTPITNISIPRVPEYSIYDDGVLLPGCVSDPKQRIPLIGNGDARFYENESLMFTLEELLNGELVPNVSIDRENEIINVSSRALVKPLKRELNVVFSSEEANTYFFTSKNEWKLYYNNQEIPLDNDLSFTLSGENIKALYAPQGFRIQQSRKDRYEVKTLSVSESSNKIVVLAEKVHRPVPLTRPARIDDSSVTTSSIDACEIQLKLDQAYHLHSDCYIEFYKSEVLLQKTTAMFVTSKNRDHIAKAYIPKSWLGPNFSIRLKSEKVIWRSTFTLVKNNNGIIELRDENFVREPVSIFSRYKKAILLIALLLVSLLVGGFVGYSLKDWLGKDTNTASAIKCPDCGETFNSETELNSHMLVKHNPADGLGQNGDEYFNGGESQDVDDLDGVGESHASQNTTRSNVTSQQLNCQYCDERFDNSQALKDHIKENHHFTCDICGENQWFHTKKELENHMKSRHNSETER